MKLDKLNSTMIKLKNILLVTLVIGLTACGVSVTKEDLVGSWKVVDYEANLQNLSPLLIKSATDIALSQTYIFEHDGSFTIDSEEELARKNGNWTISEDLKVLTLSSEESDGKQEQEVQAFGVNKLVLVLQIGDLGNETTTLEKL